MWNNIGGCSLEKWYMEFVSNNSRWYRKSSMDTFLELLLKSRRPPPLKMKTWPKIFGHVKRIWGSWPTWHLFKNVTWKSDERNFVIQLSFILKKMNPKNPHFSKVSKTKNIQNSKIRESKNPRKLKPMNANIQKSKYQRIEKLKN